MQIILGTIAIIASFIICCFTAVFNFLFPDTAVYDIRANLAMDIKPSQIEFHEDTHGWFGDGEEIIIFTPNDAQIYKIYHKWDKTPVHPEIASLIFPENGYNDDRVELRKNIPQTEGWWFYKTRSSFHNGYSYNFSFAFFDGEKVYYYEFDS